MGSCRWRIGSDRPRAKGTIRGSARRAGRRLLRPRHLPHEPARLPRPQPRIDPARRQQLAGAMPVSTMRPRSSTTSRSIRAMVDSRCAMAITVRPSISASSWPWIAASTSESSAEVASSSTRIGASFRITRASATRCRWPPDSFTPALADMRVVAGAAVPVLQAEDELLRLGPPRRVDDHRLGRVRPAVADVVADRAVQQRGVLRHHGDLRAQALLRDAARCPGRRSGCGRAPGRRNAAAG